MSDATRTVAVITGASDGIGAELARVFAAKGHDLALVARRGDRLETLADEIAATGKPKPLVIALDLAAHDAPNKLADALSANGATTKYLVNNAGFGSTGLFAGAPVDDQLGMIDLNVRALTALTHRFLPDVTAAKGGILNVASIAAYAPGPGMAVYYASKAFVLSFTEALAEELAGSGVKVSALCPGPIATGFQARAGIDAGAMKDASATMISPRAAAEQAYAGLISGQRVVVPGTGAKLLATAMAWMPHAILLPQLLARQVRRTAT